MSRVSQKMLVSRNFIGFFLKLSESGTVNRRKRKNEEVRNDDKKMKQIRIFLYQLYPFYKIQNLNNKWLKKNKTDGSLFPRSKNV